MIKDVYQRLRNGETIHARSLPIPPHMPGGEEYSIRAEYWHGIVLGYTFLQRGRVVPGKKGLMLDKATIDD